MEAQDIPCYSALVYGIRVYLWIVIGTDVGKFFLSAKSHIKVKILVYALKSVFRMKDRGEELKSLSCLEEYWVKKNNSKQS